MSINRQSCFFCNSSMILENKRTIFPISSSDTTWSSTVESGIMTTVRFSSFQDLARVLFVVSSSNTTGERFSSTRSALDFPDFFNFSESDKSFSEELLRNDRLRRGRCISGDKDRQVPSTSSSRFFFERRSNSTFKETSALLFKRYSRACCSACWKKDIHENVWQKLIFKKLLNKPYFAGSLKPNETFPQT